MTTNWDDLVSDNEVTKVKRLRNTPYLTKTIFLSSLADEEAEGWEFLNHLKNPKKVKVKKDKPQDEVFEDSVWVLMANMGFTTLNRDQHFVMSYGDTKAESQQIDVFAVDDETILFIECKSAISPKNGVFKTDIEAIGGKMNGLRSVANKHFGGKKRKCKFIFATNNYIISDEDKQRMESFKITHFDEKMIAYYQGLVKHLGSCARYQLLGHLFANQAIAGMENRIPAIRGKMGGHTYYSFSIEPEKLLKIGYVLHHTESDRDAMPTYQRLIKKSRLNSVRKFINIDHGYFPNSIIISIDSRKALQFDLSEKQVPNAVADLGILHLPQKYQSAYIIDGQHRLYGYSDSPYASTNSIPVVAFENLDPQEQIRLFMDINENQKSVPKRLRNLLNADMLWDSPKEAQRREALCVRIARDLGEKLSSPLYQLIDIEDDQVSPSKSITLENINKSVASGSFLSKYDKKDILTQQGIFDLNNSDATYKLLYSFLEKCLIFVRDTLQDEWNRDKEDGGIVLINNGLSALIRVINDVAEYLVKTGEIKPTQDSVDTMIDACKYYLDPVCRFIATCNEEVRSDIRKTYGRNGPIHCWRYFQRAVHNDRPDFNPDGLTKYWEDHSQENNAEAISMIAEIEKAVKDIVRTDLEDEYGNRWIAEIPQSVYAAASAEESKIFRETGEHRDFWDYVNIAGCRDIIVFGRHWSQLFEQKFTLDSEKKKSGGKPAKTEWLATVHKLQSKAGKANFTVSKADYQLLCEIKSKFVPE